MLQTKKACSCLLLLLASTLASAEGNPSWAEALDAEISAPFDKPEHRAFDFWIGEWEMNWRAKQEGNFYHEDEGSWTRQRVFPILRGKAIVELAWARDDPEEPGQRGFSIRYLDRERERWVMSQNWPNENNRGTAFLDQLIGEEHHGRLTMYSAQRRQGPDGDPSLEHRRYNFTDIRLGESFRWDGSNTRDRGETWNTWYVVDAHYKRALAPFRQAGEAFPSVHKQKLCVSKPHGAYDGLQGRWRGSASAPGGDIADASFDVGLVLDGCGIAGVLSVDGAKTFFAIGYFERAEQWVTYRLDDIPGTPHAYFISENTGSGAKFIEAPNLVIKDEFTFFAAPENFSTENALRRTIWTRISKDRIAFQEDARADSSAQWITIRVYELERVGNKKSAG